MRVAIVGGTGLIGWHAARALRAKGHEILIIARRPPAPALGLDDCDFEAVDLYQAEVATLEEVLDGCDALVQAAGADPRIIPSDDPRDFFFEANVETNLRLFGAACAVGVSSGVILTSYFHALRPAMANQPYVASRVESEARLLELCDGRLRLVILQPPYVFGAIPGRSSLGDTLVKAARFPLLVPKGGTNAMGARALGDAICGALENTDAAGPYLVGDENLSWKELITRFGGRAGTLPTWVLRAVMGCAGLALRLVGRRSGLDLPELTDVIASEMYFDPADGQRVLGYRGGDLDAEIQQIRESR
jgi:nucleoside-diphosphate-sugar epimerase